MLLEAKRAGYKWVGVLREGNRKKRKQHGMAHGGIGLIVSSDTRVTVLHTLKKGVMVVRLDVPGAEPLILEILYVPPAASICNKGGLMWSKEIMADAREQIQELSIRFRHTVVLGDVNHYPGSDNGRRTTADPHKRGGNTPAFWAWARAMKMAPVHGRPGQHPGFCTSRAPNPGIRADGHEVDVLMTRNAMASPVDMVVTALPPISWDDIPVHLTHRPVCAMVTLPALPAASAPVQSAPPARRWWRGPYNSAGWFEANRALLPALGTLAVALATAAQWTSPAAPVEHRRLDIDSQYTALMQALFAANERAREEAAELDDGTRCKPGPRRRYHGIMLPPHVVQLCERARMLRKAINNCTVTERRDQLRADLKTACKQRDYAARRVLRSTKQEGRCEIEHLSVFDQHKMHKLLRQVCPEDPDVAGESSGIPDEPGFPPAVDRMYSYFSRALGENRDLPPGATCADDLADFPQYGSDLADELSKPIQWGEVHLALYPPNKRILQQWPGCDLNAGCQCCDNYREQLAGWDRHDGDSAIPQWRPRIWTSKSAGPDGLPAEMLRFTRALGFKERFDDRVVVCTVLAAYFERWVQERYVPSSEQFRDSCLALLLKRGGLNKPRPNPADPKFRRPINCVGVIPKLFECVLTARITHALLRRGFFGSSQAAFLPLHSAEMHVWTLLETLQMRRKLGMSSYFLAVDWRNAYNECHLGGMSKIFEHIGFPPGLVQLLQDWGGSRTVTARVNDTTTPSFSLDRGVAQGSVLSPVLFIILMAGLSNRLARTPGLRGVSIPSQSDAAAARRGVRGPGDFFHLLQLIYADDVAVICDSPQQLQLALDVIVRWGTRWHMQLVPGEGKTEAMAFEPGAVGPNLGLPPLTAGDSPVKWTAEYKYLGYVLQWDLSNTGMIHRLRQRLDYLSVSLFTQNRMVRSLSPSLQLQLATTLITGSCAYLMGVVPFTKTETNCLSSAVRQLGSEILNIPSNFPTTLVSSATRLQCFFSIAAMHQERLYHHLRCTPYRDGIAVRLFEFMLRDPPLTGAHGCWLTRFTRLRDKWGTRGAICVPDAEVTRPWHVHRAAAIFGRSVAWVQWRGLLQQGSDAHSRTVDITTRPSHTVGMWKPVAELHFVGSLPSSGLGMRAFATPQSYLGPGANSVEALTTLSPKKLTPLCLIRAGRRALASWPFRSKGAGVWDDGKLPEELYDEPCRLCGDEQEDPFHVLLQCSHPSLVAARCTDAELAQGVTLVADELARAHARFESNGAATQYAHHLRGVIAAGAAALSVSTAGGKSLAWRLMTISPYPRCKSGQPVGLAFSLGELFDATTLDRRYLRRYANRWSSWAHTLVMRSAAAWRAATREACRHRQALEAPPAAS